MPTRRRRVAAWQSLGRRVAWLIVRAAEVCVQDFAGFVAESLPSHGQDVHGHLDLAETWAARTGLPLARLPSSGKFCCLFIHVVGDYPLAQRSASHTMIQSHHAR